MKVVIFGATGMVGGGALLECLDDPRVEAVLAVVRSPSGRRHSKLEEVTHGDFFDFEPLRSRFADCDACFFCLGVSAAGMREDAYHHLTYDLTLAAARVLAAANPRMTFCYVSGQGTDATERGRIMWARVKGKTENALLRLPFRAAFMFRPGFIQPQRGVRSKTPAYNAFYAVFGPLFPILRRLFPRSATTTVALGRALIEVAARGYARPVLETRDINALAGGDARGVDRSRAPG
jgi:uncharacterized protein YbjT (DUF2867 family)